MFWPGVRYIEDHLLGNCSAHPLDASAADVNEDTARYKFNKSLVLDMKDPRSFFHFNDQYVYSGTVSKKMLDFIDYLCCRLEVSNLSPKWDRLARNGTNPVLFSEQIQYILARRAKMY